MKRRQLASFVLLLLVLGVGGYYVYARREQFAVILTVPFWGVAALAAIVLFYRTTTAVVFRLITREVGARVGVWESILLSWTTAYWNYLPLKPGTGALAVYMKRKHDLPFSGFLAYVLMRQFLQLLGTALIGLAVTVPLYLLGLVPLLVPGIFVALSAGAVTVMLIPTRWIYGGANPFLKALSRAARAWDTLRAHRGLLARMVPLKLITFGISCLSMYLKWALIGIDLDLTQVLILATVTRIVGMVAIVPAGLGVREAVTGAVGVSLGFSFTDGVVATVLGRAVGTPLVLLLGAAASYRVFMRFLPRAERPPEEELPREALGEEAV